jgi:hypothetical protein
VTFWLKWMIVMAPFCASVLGAEVRVLLIRGADGTEVYGRDFEEQERLWKEATEKAGAKFESIGPDTGEEHLAQATRKLEECVKANPLRLWLVLAGHGTYDGREARFGLTGADLMPTRLSSVLGGFAGELVFVHTGSASEPFARALKGERRVLVTATKSGDEVFYTRFGQPFAKAIGGLKEADLDQDGQVSVLEAFLHANAEVKKFYETEERIATEHALLDDNGDGVGARAEGFEGAQKESGRKQGDDGIRARQMVLVPSDDEKQLTEAERARRDELETELETLKRRRTEMGEDDYYAALEKLMLELAGIVTGRAKVEQGK